MESKKKQPKSFIIATPVKKLLQTDDRPKANNKIKALMKEELEAFTFTDNPAGVITAYKKERYQQNYRTTTKKLPAGDNP